MKTTFFRIVGTAVTLLSLPSISTAAAVAYKADKTIGKNELKASPTCISIDGKDVLHVLLDNGSVALYDAEGKAVGGFKSDMTPPPSTMTVADGKIYLFNTKRGEKTIEYRGRKIKRATSEGIGCTTYDAKGTKLGEIKLPEAMSAADAHFVGSELAVGDLEKQQILFYQINGEEGTVTKKITKGFRLCCGIFDFCPGTAPGSILVANLGAFKVQTYAGDKMTGEFGQRGSKPEEFHGCCNPVNVATLADGSIVSVEKSPTRVKIFDKEGKSSALITGLTEMVQGCSTIPVAVDSKGAVYLASDTGKCVVKCVPGVSDKPEPPAPKEDKEADEPAASAGMKEIIEKVTPMMEAKQFDKAKAEVAEIMKKHPDMTAEEKASVQLGISLAPLVEKGDADGAEKALDEIKAAYPDSDIAKQSDEIKKSIRESIEMVRQMKKEEASDGGSSKDSEEAPEVLETEDTPAKTESK